jgi:hypothetical protein
MIWESEYLLANGELTVDLFLSETEVRDLDNSSAHPFARKVQETVTYVEKSDIVHSISELVGKLLLASRCIELR